MLTFRAKDLSPTARKKIVQEVEKVLETNATKTTYLIWDSGYVNSDLTMWSNFQEEQVIAYASIKNLLKYDEIKKFSLPKNLKEKMNKDVNYIVFPDEDYFQAFIKDSSQELTFIS